MEHYEHGVPSKQFSFSNKLQFMQHMFVLYTKLHPDAPESPLEAPEQPVEDNVVYLYETPTHAFQKLLNEDCVDVVCLGANAEGAMFYSSSTNNYPQINWMLDAAKRQNIKDAQIT
jgi:hypothetical protein